MAQSFYHKKKKMEKKRELNETRTPKIKNENNIMYLDESCNCVLYVLEHDSHFSFSLILKLTATITIETHKCLHHTKERSKHPLVTLSLWWTISSELVVLNRHLYPRFRRQDSLDSDVITHVEGNWLLSSFILREREYVNFVCLFPEICLWILRFNGQADGSGDRSVWANALPCYIDDRIKH